MLKKLPLLGLGLALIFSVMTVLAPLAQSAKPVSIRVSKSSAITGQWLIISGRLPSRGIKRIELERTLYNATVTTKKSRPDGSYRFRIRMMAMPREGYRVNVIGGPSSKIVYVNRIRQEVTLTGRGSSLTAEVFPAMTRNVKLMRRTSPTSWTEVARKATASNGKVTFSAPVGPTYRAVALKKRDVLPYYSTAWVTDEPKLEERRSDLGASGPTYQPQPDSGNSAAAKHGWWPSVKTWDWETGLGMNEWTDYSTGSGRNSVTYGGLWHHSGNMGRGAKSFGSLSSTHRGKGFADGYWEWKSRAVQRGEGFTPYTVRYSLVPAGTPDGTRPSKEIVLGQHRGYGKTTLIGLRDGRTDLTKILTKWNHNGTNWHAYGLQVTPRRITWLINSKVVASLVRPPGLTGPLTPRVELIGVDGQRMTQTTMNTDWIRYFALKDGGALSGPSGGFVSTPLASPRRQAEPKAEKVSGKSEEDPRLGARPSAARSLRLGA